MVTIVAIGGGEIGRPGTAKEIVSIDKRLLELSGKKRPRLLFLPTASGDHDGYCSVVEKYFGELGARVSHLRLIKDAPSRTAIRAAVAAADVIYVGGGNTKDMMRVWRRTGFDEVLRSFADSKKVYSGLSAGAVCWFEQGWSDSLRMKDKNAPYISVRCLGLLPGIYSPHALREPERVPDLEKYLRSHRGFAYSVDDWAALVFANGNTSLLTSRKGSGATLICSDGKELSRVRLR